MTEEIDRQLAATQSVRSRRKRLEGYRAKAHADLAAAEDKREALREQLAEEDADVQKLKGMSFTNVMVTLFGDKDRRLDEEEREAAAAVAAHADQHAVVEGLETELDEIEQELATIPTDLDDRYERLLAQKHEALVASGAPQAERLRAIARELAEQSTLEAEIDEALAAGERANKTLDGVAEQMKSAQNWGIVDLVGGGLIAGMIKHGKLDHAKTLANLARRQMARFSTELADVQMRSTTAAMDIGTFLKFADYFADGLVSDWFVQARINRAERKVRETRTELRQILRELESRRDAARGLVTGLQAERQELLG